MSLTSSPYILGVYRRHATVVVGEYSATVERAEHGYLREERYTVTDASNQAVAVCWRYGVPDYPMSTPVPHYDGGWTRAVAIAEQLATEAHERAATTQETAP